jgi:hypothetical protein
LLSGDQPAIGQQSVLAKTVESFRRHSEPTWKMRARHRALLLATAEPAASAPIVPHAACRRAWHALGKINLHDNDRKNRPH